MPSTSKGESYALEYTVRVLRLLGSFIDASGDDAAIAFADRVRDEQARDSTWWLEAIATFGLVGRARRRGETLPNKWFDLVLECDSLSYGLHMHQTSAIREIVERMTPKQRKDFVNKQKIGFSETTFEDRKNGREVEVPVLFGTWWYADLMDPEETAEAIVDAIVEWDGGKKPKEQALEIIKAVGPACVPFLDKALAAKTKPPHRALLVAARKQFPGG